MALRHVVPVSLLALIACGDDAISPPETAPNDTSPTDTSPDNVEPDTPPSDTAEPDVVEVTDTADATTPNDVTPSNTCGPLHLAELTVPFAPYAGTFSPTGHPSLEVCGVDMPGHEQLLGLTTDHPVSVRLTVDARDQFDRPYFGYSMGGLGVYGGCTNGRLSDRLVCDDSATLDVLEVDVDLEPGTSTLAIQPWGDDAVTYTLSMQRLTPVPNATCETATELTPGALVQGHTFDGAAPYPGACAISSVPRATVWFHLTQPERSRLVLDLDQEVYQTFLVPSCGSESCLTAENTSDAPREIYLGVQIPYNDRTPFDLRARFVALGPSLGCEEALPLTANTPFEVDLTTAGQGSYCNGQPAGVYHRLTVPGRHAVFFELDAEALVALPRVALLAECGSIECLSESLEDRITAFYINASTEPFDIIAFVHGSAEGPSGPVPARFTPIVRPLPAHATCAAAASITAGVPVFGDTRLGGPSLHCNVPAPGDENLSMLALPAPLYHRIEVPAGQTLHASIVADRQTGNVGALMSSCAPSCLNPHDDLPYVPYEGAFVYTNAGPSAEAIVIAVGHGDWTMGGPFELHTRLSGPATNISCAAATPVGDGTMLPAEDLAEGVDDLTSRCGASEGGALYYRVTVPPDRELVVLADPPDWAGGLSPVVVRLLEGCAGACLDVEPMSAQQPPDPVRLAWHNTTGASVERVLAVAARGPVASPFDLHVRLREPPYDVERIPTACEPMGATPRWSPPDPFFNESEPLPFAVPVFGVPMTHMSPARRGLVQLWPGPGGYAETSGPAPSAPLPTFMPNRALVAAYWGPTAGSVRIAALGGGADERLIFEWSVSRVHPGTGGQADTYTEVRIQAHLHPSGVIELHPCLIDAAPGHDAAEGVSVGLQGLGGDAMAVGFDEPGLFDPARGWRFTPR